MTALRVGIIGCGRVTVDHHLPALGSLRAAEVVALADVDTSRLADAARRYGVRRQHEDYRELLALSELDAVCVAVPVSAHAAIAADVLDAGKHLLLEKPLALTLAEADWMVAHADAARRRHGRVSTIGFNLRCHRLVAQGRRLIASGALGSVLAVRSVFTSGRSAERLPAWRRQRATGGGVLHDLAVHHIDLWRHLLQEEVVEVGGAYTAVLPPAAHGGEGVSAGATGEGVSAGATGEGVFAGATGEGVFAGASGEEASALPPEEVATLQARTQGGILVSAIFSQATGDCNEIEVFGSAARMRLSLYRADGLELCAAGAPPSPIGARLRRIASELRAIPGHARARRAGGVFRESYRRQWQAFLAAAAAGDAAPCTFEDGRQALMVTLAAHASAAHGGQPASVMPVDRALPAHGAATSAFATSAAELR